MPKDIRSYFTSTSKSTNNTKKNTVTIEPNRKRKKNLRVLSDSDEEPVVKSPRVEKKKKEKRETNEEKSKYFESSVDANDYFGKKPIKRKLAEPNLKKVGETEEFIKSFNDDNDDDWVSSCINKLPVTEESSEVQLTSRKVDKPKINSQNIQTPITPKKNGPITKGKSPISKTNSFSPQKTGSPQKTITSYISPNKNSPFKRYEALDIVATKNQQNLNNKSPIKVEIEATKQTIVNKKEIKKNISNNTKNNVDNIAKSPVKIVKKNLSTLISENTSENIVNTKEKTKLINDKPKKLAATISSNKITKQNDASLYGLWVDKYRPINLKNIIGQQGEKSNVNKLVKWLKNWFTNQNGNKKISKPAPWAKDDSGAYFKAALLSGPPGVGKTTTAHLVCKELDMDVVEFNASDTRSKKLLNQEITELLSSKSLSPYMQGGGTISRNHVLVMDEVDGMAGNEDRGGVQELISLIKSTKIPIICMCNDRNHPKIRSLANYCFDLRFHKPRVEQLKGAMSSICYKENLKIKPEILTEIIVSTNQDVRQILNHLSMLAANKDQKMEITNKEIKLGAWDVARKVFSNEEQKTMSIHDKCDLFFHDYSIAPLFVQENYLNVIPYSEKGKTKQGKMDLFLKAADSLCYGDMIENAIRTGGAWSLLPTQAVFSSLIPGDVLSGRVGGMINFPAWFGKNSRKNKIDRLSQEIQLHTRLKISASKEAVCTDYSYKLRDGITNPLVTLGSDGIEQSLQFLHDYNLIREDIESLTEISSWPNMKEPFSSIDSKIKAAFTRSYNKRPVMTPFSTVAVNKKKRTGGNDETQELLAEEENNENIQSDESDAEDLQNDGMIIVKNKDKKDNTKKTVPKKDISGSSKPRGGKRGKK